MKASISLSLVALASAAVLDRRQTGQYETMLYDLFGVNKNTTAIGSFMKLPGTPETDDKAIREKVIWGPFTLNAANKPHTAPPGILKLDPLSDVISSRVNGLCSDCQILLAQGDITDKAGKKMSVSDGIYAHHVIISDVGRQMVPMPAVARCPDGKFGGFNFNPATMLSGMGGAKNSGDDATGGMAKGGHGHKKVKRQFGPEVDKIMQDLLKSDAGIDTLVTNMPPLSIMIGGGDDGSITRFTPPKGSKLKTGFTVAGKDSINLMAEVVNYNNKDKEIYITLDYEYIPNVSKSPIDAYEVGMNAINVSPCAGAGGDLLHPPADKAITYKSPDWEVIVPGYIIDVKPHLHDGGINVSFFVNDKLQCVSTAVYGDAAGTGAAGQQWQTIASYSPCQTEIKLERGDKLRMESVYDLTKNKLRPTSGDHGGEAEGMAMATIQFAYKKKA